VFKKNGAEERLLSHLSRNEFFGEIELLRGGGAMASVRAGADGPVETLMVSGDDFLRIVHESPITADALGQIIDARLKEHSAK
jgi:CRP-like cAMP-binding protein